MGTNEGSRLGAEVPCWSTVGGPLFSMTLLPEIPKASHAALLEEQTPVEHPETFPGVLRDWGERSTSQAA